MTNDLERRLGLHRSRSIPSFATHYKIGRLLYFEQTSDVATALAREKELKGWRRDKKVELIRKANPKFEDLSPPEENHGIPPP